MAKIKLGDDVSIDLDKLIESRMVIQANSGGGKSTAVRRFIEQSFGHKQIIVLDPEGEYRNMRGKYDFVYAGKGGDAPVESRSAALLARKLLELKASAIIDLYELHMQDRKHFVKLFFESVINSPKELWHDVFFILDEADVFAPEKRESESLQSVIDMAGRGRKRGYCLIPASRRPAQLNKDVSAECNNKLIGRASQDIDRKRSAEELGFTTKEQIISLRQLEPGEFYCFGPAISNEIIKTKILLPNISSPKRGQGAKAIPLPSAKVKKILGQLADLPKEAAEEAKTNAELKAQIFALKTANNTFARNAIKNPSSIDLQQRVNLITQIEGYKKAKVIDLEKMKSLVRVIEAQKRDLKAWWKYSDDILWMVNHFHKTVVAARRPAKADHKLFGDGRDIEMVPQRGPIMIPKTFAPMKNVEVKIDPENLAPLEEEEMGSGEKRVLIAIAQHEDGISREHLTVLTGYKKSSRDTYLQRLRVKGYINILGPFIKATQEGINALGDDFERLPIGDALRQHVLNTLPEGEKKILAILIENHPNPVSREALSNAVGYSKSSRDTYLQRLKARALISAEEQGFVKAADKLFD